MSDADLEQKLAVILYADVADYSRLTGEDDVRDVTVNADIFERSVIRSSVMPSEKYSCS